MSRAKTRVLAAMSIGAVVLVSSALCSLDATASGASPPSASSSTSLNDDQDSLQQTDVFLSGTQGYHTYRIPALIVTKSGTLLAFCEGRKDNRRDHGDIDLVLRRSADGGRTWGPMQVVYEEGDTEKITIGNPCPLVDQDTGRVWLPFCRDNDDVFVTYSDDDGKTWAEPRKITQEVKDPEWGWYATGPGVGIQLKHGPHKGRLIIPCDHDETIAGRRVMHSHAFYSDDHGGTWKLGATVERHTDECQVVELNDGSVMINMRNYWGREGMQPERGGMRAIAWSRDGGQTWSELHFDKTLIEPVCQASFLRYSWGDAGAGAGCSGAVATVVKSRLLFSNPASKESRHRMTVRLSYDEGKTWPVSKLIYGGSAAYSCLSVLPDGRLGLLYERDNYEKITYTTFTLGWLTDGEDSSGENNSER